MINSKLPGELDAPNDLPAKSAGQVAAPNNFPTNQVGQIDTPNNLPAKSAGQVATPNGLPAKSAGQIDTPNNFTSVTPDKSASCAIIAYDNMLLSTYYAPAKPAITPDTYQRWSEDAGGVKQADFTIYPATPTIFGIAAHNLFSAGVQSVLVYVDSDGIWTQAGEIIITSDQPHLIEFDNPAVNQGVRFVVGASTGNTEVGVLFAGNPMRMEQPIYGGQAPLRLSAKTEYQSIMSDTGQFLGRTITKKGVESSLTWRHLTPSFVYGEFYDFIEAAKTKPFFIKWRPDLRPNDIAYCHTTSDISPTNMGGGHQLLTVSINMRGHNDA